MSFSCDICDKKYKTYRSLWNHNNKFHNELANNIVNKVRDFKCSKCNKKFTRKDSMLYHMDTACKNKDIIDKSILLENKVLELEKEMKELKGNTNNTNTKNINSNNTNNGTINNNTIYINKLGTENLLELTKTEIANIFDKRLLSLEAFVKTINFNERLPSNHSFCTTNLDSAYLSVYDTNESKIKKDRKKYFFEEIISKSVSRMEELYKINKGHFKVTKQKQIEETLVELNALKNMDMSKRTLKEMIRRLNILSYNEHDIVETTWFDKDNNIKGIKHKPKTFEEDLEMDSEKYDDKKLKDTFIHMKPPVNSFEAAGSGYDSMSESESSDSEVIHLVINKTPTNIEL